MRKHNWKLATMSGWALAIALLSVVLMIQSAQAQTYTKIHTFTGGLDGAIPEVGLTMDGGGNLYGTTYGGGLGYGGVFKLAPKGSGWVFSPLYQFTGGADGAGSRSGITIAPDGSLYGAAISGGMGSCQFYSYQGCGTVFNVKPKPTVCKTALCYWNETPLYAFTGVGDGAHPYADLALDASGNTYGVAYRGGVGYGVVYELTKGTWAQSILYTFSGYDDGNSPEGGVVFGKDRNLYGTTIFGGVDQCGVVFQLTPSGPPWTENILYTFQCKSDGGYPTAGLVFDGSGNIYGATESFGMGGGGTVFELTPTGGGWTFNTLCSFSGNSQLAGPAISLVMDAGNLYGTTQLAGAYGHGSVFKATPSGGGWTCSSIYDFTGGDDGGDPWSNVVFDGQGNLYGTTTIGGDLNCNAPNGCGVVWKITP